MRKIIQSLAIWHINGRMARQLQASGSRLYVNIENPAVRKLYEKMGFTDSGCAYFMEKACL